MTAASAHGEPAGAQPAEQRGPKQDHAIADILPRLVADALPVCIAFVDADRRYRYVNRTYEKWFGHDRAEIVGRPVADIVGVDAYRLILPHLEAALAGQPVSFRAKIPYRDAGAREVEVKYVPLRAPNGGIQGFYALIVDVGERGGPEALRLNEERLRSALERSPTVLFEQDALLRYTWVANPRRGFTLEQILGKRDEELLEAGDAAQLTAIKQGVLATGRPARGVVSMGSGENAEFYDLYVAPKVDPVHGIVGVTCDAHEITELKRVEGRLAASEARFRAIFENAGVGMAQVGLDGRWLEVNGTLCELLGYGRDTLRLATFQDLTHPDDLADDLALVEDLLAGRRATYRLEKRYRHRNGDYILAQLTVSLVRDAQGAPSNFIAIVEDIRARKALEHQLQQSTERLSLAKSSARIGIHDYNVVAGEIEWDERVRELWGVPHDLPVTYDVFINGVVPEDRPGVEQALAAAFDPASHGIFASEYRIADAAGGTCWIAATGSVQFDDGKPVRLVGTVRDITERKQAEAQRELLLQELGHRVNNMLSVVHGIVTLTARSTDSVAAFSHAISERVRSLTRTHALLLADTWESIPLHQLLREQLAAFQAGSSRINLQGRDLRLPTRIVLPLGMVVHELATNAVKYGALGACGGEVVIAWDRTDGDDGCPMLRLSWVERGGPKVVPPAREGFGSRLMDLLIVKQLRGQLTQAFTSDGLIAEISVPLDN